MTSATLEQNEQQTQNPSSSFTTPPQADPVVPALADNSVSDIRFTNFNVSDSLKTRLTSAGFLIPTPVQSSAIPPALEGKDILATASTGTGKTLSFLVPIIQRLDFDLRAQQQGQARTDSRSDSAAYARARDAGARGLLEACAGSTA